MPRVLILEDEILSAERLRRLLSEISPAVQVLASLDSLSEARRWLDATTPPPDLLFLDVQLSDGRCFELFRDRHLPTPVIFTTAYNQYAIEAFRVNSVDYLLKPIEPDELHRAMQKFQALHQTPRPLSEALVEQLSEAVRPHPTAYKSRFLVKYGDQLSFRTVQDVAFFQADGKVVHLLTTDGRRYVVDYTLEELESLLDPADFFRVNRTFLTRLQAIRKVRAVLGSRLELTLLPSSGEGVFVSRERVSEFKSWLDGAFVTVV